MASRDLTVGLLIRAVNAVYIYRNHSESDLQVEVKVGASMHGSASQ